MQVRISSPCHWLHQHAGDRAGGKYAWSGSNRDYQYEELLGRVFNILNEKNPELTGGKKRVLLKPPEVVREGTKKTVFANFTELCKMMNRSSEHVQSGPGTNHAC